MYTSNKNMEENKSGEHLEKIGWGKYNLRVFVQCGFVNFT